MCCLFAFCMFSYNQALDREWLERDIARIAQRIENAPESEKQNRLGRFGATADGSTLIIAFDGVPSGNGLHDPESYRFAGYAFACDGGRFQQLLRDGAKIRFEVSTNTGKKLEPLEVTECP